PYPAADVEFLDDREEGRDEALADSAHDSYADLVEHVTGERPASDQLAELSSYAMASTIELSAEPKQSLLEERSEADRLRAEAEVEVRRPLRTIVGLFRSKWWTIGYIAAAVGWLLHVGALGIAPLSIVQASLATGFIFLGLLAERLFGFELRKREWLGICLA